MKLTYYKLNWDSDFFKFNVGKITGSIVAIQDLEIIENLIENNNSRLTYFSSLEEIPSFVFKSQRFDISLVDKKTTFTKKINPNLDIDPSISIVDTNISREKLIELSIQSGIYSRFKIDKRIGKNKFEEMYSLWMINSLNKKIAKEVLIYIEENALAGFVTLREKNNRADIGIIAVDNSFRGKGIGKKMMTSAEKWFSNLGYKTIQVLTQGNNIPACKLYESCGYSIESVEYFYHIWKK